MVQLQKDKKQLQATVEELRAEVQAHLQDKEELAKAFEEMQNEQAGGGGGEEKEKEDKDPFDDSVPNEDEPW